MLLLPNGIVARLASVPDRTAVFETARRGSIPWRGIMVKHRRQRRSVLGVWWMRTRLCEGRGPGSTPGEDLEVEKLEMGDRRCTSIDSRTDCQKYVSPSPRAPLVQTLALDHRNAR